MNAHDVVLRPLVEQYLSRQHSLGRDYRYEGIVLASLAQFLFKQGAVDL
jgi:hypothetical protein